MKYLVAEKISSYIILANKRKISIIELRECFSKFIKSVTLFQKFFCDRSITNTEIFKRGTGPSKTDKLLNVNPVRCSTRNISIQMRIINFSEIKIVPFVVNLRNDNLFNLNVNIGKRK